MCDADAGQMMSRSQDHLIQAMWTLAGEGGERGWRLHLVRNAVASCESHARRAPRQAQLRFATGQLRYATHVTQLPKTHLFSNFADILRITLPPISCVDS